MMPTEDLKPHSGGHWGAIRGPFRVFIPKIRHSFARKIELVGCKGSRNRKHAALITQRSQVQIRPPQPPTPTAATTAPLRPLAVVNIFPRFPPPARDRRQAG